MTRHVRRLMRARGAVAALEFALIAPVLLTLVMGAFEISRALIISRRMPAAAQSVAEIASTMAVQSTNLNQLTGLEAWQASTAAFAQFPSWKTATQNGDFTITLSAIVFQASPAGCTSNCGYTPQVAWSFSSAQGTMRFRACGALTVVSNAAGDTMQSIPQGDVGPTMLLVADVQAPFDPVFAGFILSEFMMLQSAYVSPRFGNSVQFVATPAAPNLAGGTPQADDVLCPGVVG